MATPCEQEAILISMTCLSKVVEQVTTSSVSVGSRSTASGFRRHLLAMSGGLDLAGSPVKKQEQMIRAKARSLATVVPTGALLFVVFSLLCSPLYPLSAWGQHSTKEGEFSHQHRRPADEKEHGKVSHPNAHHSFEDAERWSERFDAPDREEWQKPAEVIALMEIEPGMSVADIGAGTGYFLGPLSTAVGAGGTVLGLDVEPDMVKFMTERAERENWSNVKVRTVQPDDPDLEESTIDRILIVNTWHHISDRESYSRKLHEALIPGGRVLVVDFTYQSSHGPPVSQRLRPEEVVAELRAGGLDVEILEESLPDQYVVVGRRPLGK
ncbi:MAG: methyltransferase domain-containing protein [Nitrospirota bacterium]|nr:MAG: methyltransferase domain-containing protein [Nitrospirota bacterium]